MRSLIKNRRGGFTDLFIFMIVAFVIVLFCGVFIYITNSATDEIRENIDHLGLKGDGNNNASVVLENTLGSATTSFNALYWISVFLIFGMIVAIFIGSYMVTTKPIFFIPYIFVVIIAVIMAVPISNAYETLSQNATLSSTFVNFIGANWILGGLPIIVSIVGIVGGIIMFVRMGKREEVAYYGY
jgi:hypothetical protein